MNDFDTIAPYYDRIAKAVFGNAIHNSQDIFLSKIPTNSKVLILGGGSGRIAQELLQGTENVAITYVEKSKRMIEIAQESLSLDELKSVVFVQESFEGFNSTQQYDVVVSPFFLDIFDKGQLIVTIDKIKSLMKNNGLFIVTDFQVNDAIISKLWHKPLLWFMHMFFGFISKLQSDKLQDIHAEILQRGFSIKNEKLFFSKMIFSRIYQNVLLEEAT